MAKRLAITISGAVSLGSYEAGVLYEVLEALRQHNENPETLANPDERIEIDVLSGASAGGMTAVIVVQSLLYAGSSLREPQNNPFYNPWVSDVSLDGLLNADKIPDPAFPDISAPEDSAKSILSSNLIEKLARKYITSRYEKGVPALRVSHPAAAKEIRLGLALSNLNGVAYSYPLRVKQPDDKQTFSYTRFQDEMTGIFAADGSDGKDSFEAWEPWREAAVSCGAFPFAFRVKELHRLETEYTRHHRDEWGVPHEKDFAYTDGGVFQNEPLGLAKNLVDLIDRPAQGLASSFQNADSRFYLYVAPGAKTSEANKSFSADVARFLPTAQTIVKAIFHQARFQDWVNAEEINDQINLFNVRAEQLYSALLKGELDPGVLQRAADALLRGLFQTQPAPAPGVRDDTPDDARARLRQQFKKESTELLKIDAVNERAWLDSILVLETAAELNLKDEMYIYGITATNQELAGAGLFAFLGFFDLTLRQHDYNLGRRKARAFLIQHRNRALERAPGSPEPPPDIGPIRYEPTDPIPDIPVSERDPKSGDVLVSQLNRGVRERLLKTISQRADELLSEIFAGMNVPKFLVGPLSSLLGLFIKGELKKRLAL
jgi:Patatin-like phospholipase